MSIFNGLTFDGINSLDYDVYITGEAVYNTPERDVESIEIPGRSGDYLQDNGRWKNIEVTYKAGVFGDDQSEFASKIRNYRNALASRIGYKRITDTYNPNEYRLGAFVKPVEVEPKSMSRTGEFDIIFNCKPQRWLTSGEQEITVETGDVVTNPTPYDASPLLMVEGYGAIDFNGYEIDIDSSPLGNVNLLADKASNTLVNNEIKIESAYSTAALAAGDTLTYRGAVIQLVFTANPYNTFSEVSALTRSGSAVFNMQYSGIGSNTLRVNLTMTNALTWSAGTAFPQTVSNMQFTFKQKQGTTETGSTYGLDFVVKSTVNGTSETLTVIAAPVNQLATSVLLKRGTLKGFSTVPILGHPTYIDTDAGEAYKIENGERISLNSKIAFGSNLPKLAPGNNEFTLDNTITELKIVPGWWIL